MKIRVGARSSKLSQVQVQEVLEELRKYVPEVKFETFFVKTTGDRDQKTSLRTMDKTDFFTKEIDEMVLDGKCQVAIHSAKDLPEPIPKGLKLLAMTKGVDPADSLVMREGSSLESLPVGAKIGTSSERRENAVRKLRSDLSFIDIRGTIERRLRLLETGAVDGLVIAEAALIRLNLMHLNRLKLTDETVAFQGRLAVIGREKDKAMLEMFSCIA